METEKVKYLTKQTIVVRKDLKMNRGKEIAQCAHAAMAWLTKNIKLTGWSWSPNYDVTYDALISEAEKDWLENSFTKIVLQVNSEEELMSVYNAAEAAGLEVHLITDNGKTYFDGVPTKTCLAIGPDWCEKIDKITKSLKKY